MLFKKISIALAILMQFQSSFAEEQIGNLLECPVLDITNSQQKGQTFLSLLQTQIKPELDSFATEGYKIVDGDRLVSVLDLVDKKVRRQALGSLKGSSKSEKIQNLKTIGDMLAGQMGSLYRTHELLAQTGLVRNRFKLSTYVGLASCAGSSLKLADDNYAYNVHYGTGAVEKDDRTGRSFGASRIFQATDSSYTHYLKMLERYIKEDPTNISDFMLTVMETLTNTEPRRYENVTDLGDSVLTDFLAIWIAEQDRNLMDGKVKPHWDAALFQVTLLAAFHAGQEQIKMFYKDPLTGQQFFTDRTFKLAWPKKNHTEETCVVDLESQSDKKASLTDYIGVHYMTYKHCGRSGVNMSRKEWRLLGQEITSFLMESKEGQALLEGVRKYTTEYARPGRKPDIIRELARFLINDKTPKKLSNWYRISGNTVKLLKYVQKNAPAITEKLEQKYPTALVRQ